MKAQHPLSEIIRTGDPITVIRLEVAGCAKYPLVGILDGSPATFYGLPSRLHERAWLSSVFWANLSHP
jgi:hypothetical protein